MWMLLVSLLETEIQMQSQKTESKNTILAKIKDFIMSLIFSFRKGIQMERKRCFYTLTKDSRGKVSASESIWDNKFFNIPPIDLRLYCKWGLNSPWKTLYKPCNLQPLCRNSTNTYQFWVQYMFYAYWECFQSYRTTIYFITPPPLKTTVCALLLIINPWAEIQQMPIDSQYNICFMPIENVSSHLGWIFFFICVRGDPLLCKNHKNRQFYFEKS